MTMAFKMHPRDVVVHTYWDGVTAINMNHVPTGLLAKGTTNGRVEELRSYLWDQLEARVREVLEKEHKTKGRDRNGGVGDGPTA